VRGDLLQIAQAERGYIATNGHCAALDELVSSNSLSLSRSEREDIPTRSNVPAAISPPPRGTHLRRPLPDPLSQFRH